MQQFKPEEITVKTTDEHIIVEGKHEEKPDEHGQISRHFVRLYQLPKDIIADDIKSTLSSDGVLTVTAPLKEVPPPPPENERVIPITRVEAKDGEGDSKAKEKEQATSGDA